MNVLKISDNFNSLKVQDSSDADKRVYNPKSLKELASAAIPLPANAKPLSGMGIQIKVNRHKTYSNIKSVVGMDCLVSYMCVPTIAQLFKDYKFEKALKIAIIPYYLDQQGDIKIVLQLREFIKKTFGVEPLIIMGQESYERTYSFLRLCPSQNGLTCIALDTVTKDQVKDVDLFIHGPALYLAESCHPTQLLQRYPRLCKAIDWKNPPPIISLLEAESPGFSFSATEDYAYKVLQQLIGMKDKLKDVNEHQKKTKKMEQHQYNDFVRIMPLLIGAGNQIRETHKEIFELASELYEVLANLINDPSEEGIKKLNLEAFLQQFTQKLEKEWSWVALKIPSGIFRRSPDSTLSYSLTPWTDSNTSQYLLSGVLRLHEFQVGLNRLFSLGCFPLPDKIRNWKKAGMIDSVEGRKKIFDNIEGHMSPQDTEVLLALSGKRYIVGYGHNNDVKERFILESRKANPWLQHALINMSFRTALEYFPRFNIIDHASNRMVERNSDFTVHLYSQITSPIFEGIVAASDPCCRLAGGDNSFFTSLTLGCDDLFYELRSFKQGMLLALFQLANELEPEEKNCIVDRMLGNVDVELLKKTMVISPQEYKGFMERKAKGILSIPGSLVFRRAFRKIGDKIFQQSERFSGSLAGIIKMKIFSRRFPEITAQLDGMIGGTQNLFKNHSMEKVQAFIESNLLDHAAS